METSINMNPDLKPFYAQKTFSSLSRSLSEEQLLVAVIRLPHSHPSGICSSVDEAAAGCTTGCGRGTLLWHLCNPCEFSSDGTVKPHLASVGANPALVSQTLYRMDVLQYNYCILKLKKSLSLVTCEHTDCILSTVYSCFESYEWSWKCQTSGDRHHITTGLYRLHKEAAALISRSTIGYHYLRS